MLSQTSWKRHHIAGDGEEEKGFPGKVSFSSLQQNYISLLVPLVTRSQEKEGIRPAGNKDEDAVVRQFGDWQDGLGEEKKWG